MRRIVPIFVASVVATRWAPASAAIVPAAAGAFGIPTRVASPNGVLLTFDDGPHPQGTPAVLEALGRAGAHAVFFVSGEQAERHPALVRRVVEVGHEIGVHGYRHQSRRQWTRRLVREDILRALDAISAATGTEPTLYRPPHGTFSRPGLKIVEELDLTPLLWSKWGRDWQGRATPDSIVRRTTNGLVAGDVILLHDADHYGARGSWTKTAAAIEPIVEAICGAGLETVRWSESSATNEKGAAAEAPSSRRLILR